MIRRKATTPAEQPTPTSNAPIQWVKLGDRTQEGAKGQFDFVISPVEPRSVILDVFESSKPTDEAHVESIVCKSVAEAKATAEAYGDDQPITTSSPPATSPRAKRLRERNETIMGGGK